MDNNPDKGLIAESGLFSETWYRSRYPDVDLSEMNALDHYVKYGSALQRHPSDEFDARWYCEHYLDVANAGQGALIHWLKHGRYEGRKTKRLGKPIADYRLTPGKRFAAPVLYNWDQTREDQFRSRMCAIYDRNRQKIDNLLISIVMPTYNRADVISSAIDSVLRQQHQLFELLVVDDGSTDQTESVVRDYALEDSRIRFIRGGHGGVSHARNLGLREARGEYIFYLDTDNVWYPHYVRLMLSFMAVYGVGACYSGSVCIGNDRGKYYRGDDFNWSQCHQQNYLDINSFAHRASLLQLDEWFDTDLKRLTDWDFILRHTRATRTVFLPFVGVQYFDGEAHGRITKNVYQGEKLRELEKYIRAKTPLHQPAAEVDEIKFPLAETLMYGDYQRLIRAREFSLISSNSGVVPNLENYAELSAESESRDASLVSIIIVCYGRADLTKACIESIFACSPGSGVSFELIAVDNGSPDNTREVIAALQQKHAIKYIRNETNLMFSMGNNLGAAAASGAFLLFLNNDTVVTPGWLEPLFKMLTENDEIGLAGPKLLYPDDTIQCAGIVFNAHSSIPYHIYRGVARTEQCVNRTREFKALTGACMLIRARDFFELEGFDTRFVNGCEDIDLCLRLARDKRKKVMYVPQSEIYHHEGKSEGRGRNIPYNRELLWLRWGEIPADDATYYAKDGFEALAYEKPGAEEHGLLAAYRPILEPAGSKHDHSGSQILQLNKAVNIGFVTIWHVRGISIHTLQIADALESEKIKTHIFARWESERFSNCPPVYHPRVFNGGDDPTGEALVKWCTENGIAVLVFMETHPKDWKRAESAKAAGIRIICYENLDILRREFIPRYGIFDGFLFNTFYTRQVMLEHFPDKPSLTIPWGIPPRSTASTENAGPSSSVKFVHVAGWGGINNRKNTGLLIEVFHELGSIQAELHIYTQSPVSTFGQPVALMCQSNPRIHVHEGTIDNIDEAYAEKDVLLWPSKREGVGLPILEALVHGLPVLIADGYMMKQWIMPGVHGLVCPATPLHGQMLLPEMQVNREELKKLIKQLAADHSLVSNLKNNVKKDIHHWQWTWQRAEIQNLFLRFCQDPNDSCFRSLDYLPARIIDFENQRREMFNEASISRTIDSELKTGENIE